MPIGPGTKLGSYVVQDAIGQGAMGVVYRAYHAQLERECAVKVLQAIGADPDTAARFRREAQAIARMRHPNVLNVFDFGEFEGTPYMIVEYVAGGSLAPRVKSGPLDRTTALSYLRGIGDALDYAHKHGIVHRDVKPANVLLGPDDNPILADFGLAKLMESSSIKSLTGVTTGTPAYMAPEQVTGSQVGPAADRYSLAVIAYEMLTGSLPFEEGGVLEVLYAQVHKEAAPPSMLDHALPKKVDAVILRGMSKDPAARWEKCSDFVAALDSALKTTPAPVEKTIAFAPPPPTVEPRPPKPPRRAAKAKVEATTVMAAEPAEGPIRGPDPTLPHPVITWGGFAVPGVAPPRRSNRRRALVIGVVLLILVLLLGTCAFLITRPPDISLSKNVVRPGDRITVTATHLPADKQVEIQLLSDLLIFPARSDALGRATRQIDIPFDIDPGDHTVRVCWNGSCPLSTTLRVVGSVALASPTPIADVTPTPVGGSPTPGVSSQPTASPTHTTTTSPSPRQSPNPTPSSNPCPVSGTRALSPASATVVGGQTITYNGSSFTPNTVVTLKYLRGSTNTLYATWTANVGCNGKFTTTVKTPAGVVEVDHVTACDPNACATPAKLTLAL